MPEEAPGPDDATCGTGLAESAELPRRLADVAAGLAVVFRQHLTAIYPQDEASKPEYEAYVRLAEENEHIAARLRTLADEMSGCRNLPMANHDMKAMTHPRVRQAFETFVEAKQHLKELLESEAVADQEMLKEMQG